MSSKILLLLKKFRELPENNLSLILSLILNIIQLTIVIYTSVFILPISYLEALKWFFLFNLILLTLESLVKLLSQNKLFRSYSKLELLSSLPSWILIIFFPENFYDAPGVLLIKGMLFLRLFPLLQILLEEKTFHLKEHLPIFFNKMVSVVSISSFIFIYSGGLFTIMLYDKYIQKEKEYRISQITHLLKIYSIEELPNHYPQKWILKIERRKQDKHYEIFFIDREMLKSSLIPNIHFSYVVGKFPDESIIVSFLDLYQNKNYLELIYMITSLLMIGGIYFLLYFYYKKFVFLPLEKGTIVLELRLMGEDIKTTDLPDLKNQHNEIIEFIKKSDLLYKKLTELER
ncbi:MAG: hypothetical protein NZ853_05190 [Leptospiraceae bacterium]|nr:hypothetical protein [Leptospiraceae bacterium]MDW7976658.1 hypothetical protein [Leptospiraceae bacterium]